ncbi:MAG: hypothetical protein QOH43_1402 [Solirubrobacteraceae bacterium]|jgi:hypothetical protein|nr:hypothetical protein [Solirubrobacteraceae bacterium]
MSAFDRLRPPGRRRAEQPAPVRAAGRPLATAELRARRDELAERVAQLTWDLGGLTYEMAIRDHFRLDVLVRRAAELQQADAELGEHERLLAAAEDGIAGQCRSCGAVHARGAVYCWACGQPLMLEVASRVVPPRSPDHAAPALVEVDPGG